MVIGEFPASDTPKKFKRYFQRGRNFEKERKAKRSIRWERGGERWRNRRRKEKKKKRDSRKGKKVKCMPTFEEYIKTILLWFFCN